MPTRLVDDPFVIDDAYLEVGAKLDTDPTYDLSDVSTKIEGTIQFGSIDIPPTFGKKARKKKTTKSYTVIIVVTFRTNGYGADALDGIMTKFLPAPEGTGKGELQMKFSPAAGAASATNPVRSGTFSFDMWKPMGDGENETIAEQTITFTLAGDDYAKAVA